MKKKINFEELVDILVNPQKQKIKDLSQNGQCSKCGECCSNFLPVCQEEIDAIQEYVIKNNIKPSKEILVMQNELKCPYWKEKCMIYEVRPLICREFYCYKKPSMEMAEKFSNKKYISVNMWKIAEVIDKQRKRKSIK